MSHDLIFRDPTRQNSNQAIKRPHLSILFAKKYLDRCIDEQLVSFLLAQAF